MMYRDICALNWIIELHKTLIDCVNNSQKQQNFYLYKILYLIFIEIFPCEYRWGFIFLNSSFGFDNC